MLLAEQPDQHHRHPRPRRLHGRGGALAARAGRCRRRVRRQGGRRAPVGDRLASGRQVQRPADLLRQQDGQARRGLLLHRRHDHQPPQGDPARAPAADRRRARLRRRRRPDLQAGAHLARRRAEGRGLHDRGDPGGPGRQGRGVPPPARRDGRGVRRGAAREVPRWRGADRGRDQGRDPQADDRRRDLPGAVRLGVQEQGRAAHARRRDRLPAVPAGRAGRRGPQARPRDGAGPAQAQHLRAVLRARVQGRRAPVLRQADLRPGLLGQGRLRHAGAQLDQGQEGAHREDVPDALQQGEPGRRGRRRPHLRVHRAQGRHHR